MANKVKIQVSNMDFVLTTNEEPNYVLSLASELDNDLTEVIKGNPSLSINQALVLCCISYIDNYKKSENNSDNMRNQLTDYLEDAAKARIELDETKRELERLKRKLGASADV